ncbi:MAG: Asp-tRNA(Asn)/Glu-tRNA(Gln) amidotransferase subunit GatA [Clostridia bacterium]|nr:Asp-tRNA(Asn)/Glu-tRNA(Gln) amidotransferase subunit GatA [Clostridia bacterium]
MSFAKQNILGLSVTELSLALSEKWISSQELTEAYLSKIEESDGDLGAYLTVTAEIALSAAKRADILLSKGNARPLCGVPTAYKDNLCVAGVPTTCASKMLEGFIPPYSATAVKALSEQGAVMLGKLNMDEFAMGSSCCTSAFRLTRNPLDRERVPGGSSGGCAAAVVSEEAPYAIGTDTGGSVRQPAAFCGAVGLKPTYGRISRYGLIAFASSLDQIGVISRTVSDSALILNALTDVSARDTHDATLAKLPPIDFSKDINSGIRGLRLGIAPQFFGKDITREISLAVDNAVKTYNSLGATIVNVNLPSLKYALPAYYVISSAEASSNLSRYDGVRYGHRSSAPSDSIEETYICSRSEGFGDEVKRRILLGTYVLSKEHYSDYYQKALKVCGLIRTEFDSVFHQCDALIAPVTPTPAFKIERDFLSPVDQYNGDIYTVPASLAGLPAISVPCGTTSDGLPIGMQIICRPYDEKTLLRVARSFEAEVSAR